MTGHRVLIEELWNPAQPQPEQRQLMPRDSVSSPWPGFLEKLSRPNRIPGNGRFFGV
jgi:hypothetical protein